MTTTETAVNVVRLTRGSSTVTFEISKGCRWAWMQTSRGATRQVKLDRAREHIARAARNGWTVAAV